MPRRRHGRRNRRHREMQGGLLNMQHFRILRLRPRLSHLATVTQRGHRHTALRGPGVPVPCVLGRFSAAEWARLVLVREAALHLIAEAVNSHVVRLLGLLGRVRVCIILCS